MDAVLIQVVFPIANVPESFLPDILVGFRIRRQRFVLEYLGVNANYKVLFVMLRVEDPDHPAAGKVLLTSPEKVVVQLLA